VTAPAGPGPSVRRAAAWAALLPAALVLAGPAAAQNVSDIPPPLRHQVDENGVDVARGEHLLNVADLGIGPPGQSGLAYVRQLRRTGGGHPYDLGLFLAAGRWTASVGLAAYAFTKSGTLFASSDGSGATLVQNGAAYSLTTPDGAVVVYDFVQEASDDVNRVARATSITYPTGEQTFLAWVTAQWCSTGETDCAGGEWVTAVRLQSVRSSLRYQLHFTYARGSAFNPAHGADWRRLVRITAINTLVDHCDPFAGSCTVTQAWPTATYSGSTVTDPEGRTSSYASDSTSFRIRRPGSASDDVRYNYGADGRIASVVRDGLTWTYAYSVSGNAATMVVTDPGGHSRTIVSDLAVGLPTSVTDAMNRTTSYAYDPAGRLIRATAPEGNQVEYDYDQRGNIVLAEAVARPGSGTPAVTARASYPAACANPRTCNRPTSTTDANGHVTDYSYDPTHGGIVTITAPAPAAGPVRPQTRYAYASLATPAGANVHRLTRISACATLASCDGGADEVETVIAYNHGNLLVSDVTRRDGAGTLVAVDRFGYDSVGNRLTVDGPLAGTADTVRTRYNLAGEVTGTVSPDPDGAGALEPRAQRITRSPATGLVTRVETGTVAGQSETDWAGFAPLERVDIAYDSHGRPVQRSLAGSDGAVQALTRTGYDMEGRLWCVAVRMNPARFAAPLADACAPDTAGGFGPDRISRTGYDAVHRPVRFEAGIGTADAATEVETAYTANGRILHATDGQGNRTTYEYDGHDRLVRTRFPVTAVGAGASSASDDELLTLDDAGNVLARTLRDGTSIAFSYDALGRLSTKDPPGAGEPTVTYGYDNLGRMISASSSAQALAFAYDALGRNVSQSGPLGATEFLYDLAGRRTRLDYPGVGLAVHYDYLATGEVTRIRENGATSGIGVLATFGYDQLGRRSSLTRGNGTVTAYGYDSVSRLASLVQALPGTGHDLTLAFTYNPAGQIAAQTRSNDLFSYTAHANRNVAESRDGLNRLTAIGGAALGYDVRHNIALVPAAASGTGSAATYLYNSENLLVGGGGIALAYDPLMRLYQVGATRWAYDGTTLIAEYGSTGALLRRFVHGPGIDEPLVWYEGPGLTVRRFLHADERGSIVAISDSAGTVIGTNRYDEYGVPQGAVAGRFHYTGQPWIASLGLYYYRARFYHPHLGRFMQPDPIGYGGGMNMYAYVRGDPVNLRDPSGLNPGYREDFSAPECIGADICVTGTGWSKQVGLDLARGLLINALGGGTGSSTGEAAAAEEETIVVTGTRSPPGPPPRRPLPVPPPPPAFVLAAAREPTNWCTWSPESVGGIDVSEACRQHDNCLGSPIRRSTCDQQFGAAVYIECRRQGGDAATCLVIAAAYRSGVWIGTLLGV